MFLCSIFLRLPTLLSTTQAYEQKHKNNDYHFVIIGSPDWDRNSNRIYQLYSYAKRKTVPGKRYEVF